MNDMIWTIIITWAIVSSIEMFFIFYYGAIIRKLNDRLKKIELHNIYRNPENWDIVSDNDPTPLDGRNSITGRYWFNKKNGKTYMYKPVWVIIDKTDKQ